MDHPVIILPDLEGVSTTQRVKSEGSSDAIAWNWKTAQEKYPWMLMVRFLEQDEETASTATAPYFRYATLERMDLVSTCELLTSTCQLCVL